MHLHRSVVACLVLSLSAGVLAAREQDQAGGAVTLTETTDWIKSRIDGESTDTSGVHLRTGFWADGCRASFRKDGGSLTLSTGVFNLKDIAYVDVIDRPIGTLWTSTFLVFKSANGQALIMRGDLSLERGRPVERPASSFDWHLGSVRAGISTTDLRELGGRLRAAFAHAVQLGGGAVKKEPF